MEKELLIKRYQIFPFLELILKDTHIGSIMITTALNLSQAIKQRKARACCAHSSLNFNSLFENILAFDFSTSVPSSTNHDTNPLIKYLREKGYNNFSSFLELSNK